MQSFLKKLVLRRLESYTQKLLEVHQPKVIAITGSVGKTSTKQAIAHVLKSKYRVLAHQGNYNTEFGLPLSLFELEAPTRSTDVISWLKIFIRMRQAIAQDTYPYDVVVLEMGADRPGDIEHFMSYIQPDIGVVTAVAKVHIEEFKSVEAILSEKWKLAEGSKEVLYNHDDPRLRKRASGNPQARGYGLEETDYWADLFKFDPKGAWKGELHLGDEAVEVSLPVIARQSVYGLVAAAGIGKQLGLSYEKIVAQLGSWQQPAGRMRILKGKNQSIIVDDSYNASPYATVAALDALQQFPGKKLAILGMMNELGDYEEAGHRLVGQHAAFLDGLFTIGRAANEHLADAASAAGLDEEKITVCASPYEAGEKVVPRLKPGMVVLVKGSQNGVFAEEAIKSLLANPEDADQLVRQSPAWLAKKKAQF